MRRSVRNIRSDAALFGTRLEATKQERTMKTTRAISLAAAMMFAGCNFALAQAGGGGGEGAKGGDAHPPAAVKQQPGETKSAPAQGAQAPAPTNTRDTGMPAGSNNSTGNMNTKGGGRGTTGTGGPGGSGNR
jgi:hypothetical protein